MTFFPRFSVHFGAGARTDSEDSAENSGPVGAGHTHAGERNTATWSRLGARRARPVASETRGRYRSEQGATLRGSRSPGSAEKREQTRGGAGFGGGAPSLVSRAAKRGEAVAVWGARASVNLEPDTGGDCPPVRAVCGKLPATKHGEAAASEGSCRRSPEARSGDGVAPRLAPFRAPSDGVRPRTATPAAALESAIEVVGNEAPRGKKREIPRG